MKSKKIKYTISAIIIIAALVLVVAVKLGPMYNFYIIPPSASRYGKVAISIMDKEGIYNNTKEWKKAKKEAISNIKSAKNYSDTYEILTKAVKVAGGKHSNFIKPTSEISSNDSFQLPTVSVENNILYIKLPQFTINNADRGNEYAETVLDFLHDNQNPKGVILDLRGNLGGDMGVIIAAISPILSDGKLIYSDVKRQKIPVTLEDGSVVEGSTSIKVDRFKLKENTPIAILTDNITVSSSETVLIAFRGMKNVKVFGSDIAGYASCNEMMYLYDGAILQITKEKDILRDKEELCKEQISPDVKTRDTKEDATSWINREYKVN